MEAIVDQSPKLSTGQERQNPASTAKDGTGAKEKQKTKSLKRQEFIRFFHLVFPLRPLRPLRWILAFVFPAPPR